MQCYSKLVTQIYYVCEFYTATVNQARLHSIAQRFLNFFQIIFSAFIKRSPSDGGNARGDALSTENQDTNLGENYLANSYYPKKDGAS